MNTPRMLDKLAAISEISMALKELLRDIVLNICAFCQYGEKPGYPVYTSIDEDAYGPEQTLTVDASPGTGVTRYLATVLNDVHLDQVRITVPELGTADILIQITINGTSLFSAAIRMLGTDNSGPGTMKLTLADFDTFWQSNPIPDAARIDVVTSYLNVPGDPFTAHLGLRIRLEGRWL